MTNQIFLHSLFLVLAIGLTAQPVATASSSWKQQHEALDETLAWGDFAVFYTREGVDIFPKSESRQPLQVRYLGQLRNQIEQAREVYTGVLGLIPPLQMPVYARGRGINIHITNQKKGMGAAGDRLVRYNYRKFGRSPPVLSISLASRWIPPNLTPQHEVFHLYQYGYTFFKTGWFLEGLARSMERFFTTNPSAFTWERLPASVSSLKALITRRYGANKMWNRLAMLCDTGCPAARSRPNRTDGEDVPGTSRAARTTNQVCGGSIVRPLLEALDEQDDRAATARGLDPTNWPETEQRSTANNPYILSAIKSVLESSCPLASSSELRRFHTVVTMKVK